MKFDIFSLLKLINRVVDKDYDNFPYPPEFNDEFKLKVKKRDGFRCLKCNMSEEDHIRIYGIKEAVHHINFQKQDTTFSNCCTLCVKCNLEVNSNRYYWKNFFQSILSEQYGYQYNEMVIAK